MPSFVNPECPFCKKNTRIDLEKLLESNGVIFKDMVHPKTEKTEELIVTCDQCGQEFKLMVRRRSNAEKE